MKAQKFHGDADGPDLIVAAADDGTPLPGLVGWECWACATLYADREVAERCCARSTGGDVPHVRLADLDRTG